MAANSLARRILKRALFPLLNEKNYRLIQGIAKAWDIRTGSWWEPELELIPPGVWKGETALDIGANYGLYCYHLSRAVGSAGQVWAFEPIPFTADTLKLVSKILRFRNVEIVPKGCSDRQRIVGFTLPIQGVGPLSAGLAHINQRNNDRDGKGVHFPYQKTEEISCEVVQLDHFLPEPASLSFIKCDIEGAELLALRGAQRLIERHHPSVVCEINPWFLEGFGIKLTQLLAFFFDQGYRLYRYETRGKQRLLRAVVPEEVVEDNYLFVHPTRLDRFRSLLEEGVG